jgi:lipopolysaccharide export system ATP-binding protein|tara:strand:+ start:219 stop:995 length:777 start_codon:yes stop_codon:yes gene_type:complete
VAIIKKFRIKSFKKRNTLVELKNISLSYGKRQILENVSFNITKGEILGILGPNGVGKSTIFNLITGLVKPNYGSIFFNKIDATNYPIYLRTSKFKIGYVPQHGGYFHNLTVKENLTAVGQLLIKDKTEREASINFLIAKFQLDSVSNIKAQVISGGQKKRLVIALALLGKPKLLLMDEPFAALDLFSIKMLQEIIVNLQTENNIGICLCDHLARDLLSCVDVAIVLSDCKIIAKGTPSEIIRNTNAKSAYFGDSFKFN